jgi:protein TonB
VPDSVRRKDSLLHAKAKSVWAEDGVDTSKSDKKDVDTAIVDHAEKMPEFAGGRQAMMDYIKSHVHYPKEAARENKQGFVILKAVIEKDGHIGAVIIKKGLCDACNQEALRLVKHMPKWQPGSDNGDPKRVYVDIPVNITP